jgi:putative inorganic carbon (hco3(-)) transporter
MQELTLLAMISAVAASAGALARTTRIGVVHAAGLPLLVIGWIGLAAAVLPEPLRERALLLVGAFVLAAAAIWLLARSLTGREHWLLAAGAAVLTVRLPVPTGDATAMLLAPLYVVVAVGAVMLMRSELARLRGRDAVVLDRGGATRMLDVGTLVLPALATLSLAWSWDPDATTQMLAFYLVPFVLVHALVRAWLSHGIDWRPAAIALVASGLVYATVGLVQAATRQVWWNPKVIDANRFRPDFRTNSLLWDPNMYGRALVVVLLVVVAWLLVTRLRTRTVILACSAVAALSLALWHTYSQSSWLALAGALALLGVLTLPPRARRWVAAALVVLLVVGTPVAVRALDGDDVAGRASVVRTGIALTAERPLLGWGMGAFEQAATDRERGKGIRDPGLVASHTTPVTVIAELGILGAIAYLTLLTSAMATMLARWRRASTPASVARASGADPGATGWPDGPVVWAGATIAALFGHSLLYAGFFEDPTLWVALAVLASLPVVTQTHEGRHRPHRVTPSHARVP